MALRMAAIITVRPLPTRAKSGPGQAPVRAQPMPKSVPMAQRLSLGHSAINIPPSTAVTMPSSNANPRAGMARVAAAASSITPSVASRAPTNSVRLTVL